MRSRVFAIAISASLFAACSATPTVIPARNLERPSDMGFVCLAIDPATGKLSGQPMCQCHPPGKQDPAIQVTNSSPRQLGTFAMVTNTARGELAAVDLDKGRLIDLDPSVFGFNMLPVGSMPESLSASYDGCWVATANRNSCDLNLVDPSSLLASLFKFADGAVPLSVVGGDPTVRVTPQTASGRPLHASPKEIAFLLPDRAHGLCQAAAEQSALCQPAALSQPLALVTFPSCDLVALLDMSSGKIQDSVYIRSQGAIPAGKEPTCPVDCNPESSTGEEPSIDQDGGEGAPASDGGIGDGQANSPDKLRVGALALLPDSSRVYVGASAADDFIAALDIVDGAFSIPSGGGKIALEPGAIGIDRMRLSVDPFKLALEDDKVIDSQGSFLEGRGKFLYAFARDGSVRVVNVEARPEQECDVNAQPNLAGSTDTGCFPVNPQTRKPLAQGPGIRIPSLPVRTAAPPIPRDIAVVDLPVSSAGINKNPQALAGQFGFLLASNDTVYILNLAPTTLVDGVTVNEVSVQTHSFREVRATGQLAADMLLLSSTPPLRTLQASDLLFPTTPALSASSLPRLEKVTVGDTIRPYSAVSTNYTTTDYWADFPYPSTSVSRVFSIVWEDTLPDTVRSSGKLSEPVANLTAGALDDAGGNFCAHDVLAGDLVALPGCTADTDCNPQDRFSCRQPVSGATGLCLRKDASQEVIDGCARFSGSRRRYEILTAKPTRLELGLHLDEVPKTSLNRPPKIAEIEGDCQPTDSHKPSGNRLGFSWQQVWPNETFKRCVQPCGTPDAKAEDADRDCRPGFVCETIPGSLAPKISGPVNKTGYCVEAPPLKLECWSQPGNRYHVDVGKSFLVSGSALPDLKTGQTVEGQCQLDPYRDPVLTNRIPLSAPLCKTIDGVVPIENIAKTSTPTQAALFGQAPPRQDGLIPPNLPYAPVGAPRPNPCLYQDANYDDLTSTAQTASPDGGVAALPVKALFQNPQIRFVLTNLDQYGGDNLSTRINLTGGFIPATVALPSYDVALTQPIRIYTGPTKLPDSPFITEAGSTVSYPYVYILDQGRTALTPNSRGQIVRLNARKGANALTTLDPANSGTTPFQIQ